MEEVRSVLDKHQSNHTRITTTWCNSLRKAGKRIPEKVKEEFGSRKTKYVVAIVTEKFSASCQQEIGYAEAKGKRRITLWERSLPFNSKQSGVFLSDGEEVLPFDGGNIKDATKELAKRIFEVEEEHTIAGEVKANIKRITLGGIAIGCAVAVTVFLLPMMPLSSQLSIGGVTDIATALVLRYL